MEKTPENLEGGIPPQENYVPPGQPPVAYGQQPPPYGAPVGQPQQVYVQGYPSQPQYVQYGQQPGPSTVVVINQPAGPGPRTEWIMPQGKVPSILMIMAGVVNFICFIAIGATSVWYPEFVIAFIIYLITGILGVSGSTKIRKSQGILIGCLVMAIISLGMAVTQLGYKATVIGPAQWLSTFGGEFGRIWTIILWVNIVLLIVALGAFALSITLIVLPSKLICSCCNGNGRAPQQAGGVVFQQPPPPNMAMVAPANPAMNQQFVVNPQAPAMAPQLAPNMAVPPQDPGMQAGMEQPGMQQPQPEVAHIS